MMTGRAKSRGVGRSFGGGSKALRPPGGRNFKVPGGPLGGGVTSSSTPEWLPEGAAVAANLAEGTTLVDGEAVAITTIAGTDAFAQGVYNAALVGAHGYTSDSAGSEDRFDLIGAASAIALDGDGFVLVAAVRSGATAVNQFRMMLTDGSDWNTQIDCGLQMTENGAEDNGSWIASLADDTFEDLAIVPGLDHIIAYRLTPAGIAASVDGQAIVTLPAPTLTPTPTSIGLGVLGVGCALKWFALFPAADKTNADLPALSAL